MKVKAMPRKIKLFWEHILHESYSFIFIRPVPPHHLFFLKIFYLKITYNFNCLLLQVGKQILEIFCQRNEAWSRMSHLGWHPFKALGHKHTKEFWTYIADNYLIKFKSYLYFHTGFFLQVTWHQKYFLIASEKLLL